MKKLIQFTRSTLDTNYHGPNGTTLRGTWLWVRMGTWDHYWCLYLYRRDGSNVALGIRFPWWRSKTFGGKKG